jgi:hypothetical protein
MKKETVTPAKAGAHHVCFPLMSCVDVRRWVPAFAGMTVMLLASLAHAGDVSILNSKGMWQPTACKKPAAPAFVGLKGASAETLNKATVSYNQYVAQTDEYISCLSGEARKDSEASTSLINATLDKRVQDAQAEVKRTRAQFMDQVK